MDSTLVPIERVYEVITTPLKTVAKSCYPQAGNLRSQGDPECTCSLGKELFADMGPDGEDGLTIFLQTKLKEWQVALHGFKQLADTGSYPGGDEIAQGLTLIGPLIADKESRRFIERFNTLKKDLLDLADRFQDLEHFYDHQRPTWEKLRKAHATFQLNRLELQKDVQAGAALTRMQEILSAPSPYELIKLAMLDNLISSANAVNQSLLSGRRAEVVAKIDAHITALNKDLL